MSALAWLKFDELQKKPLGLDVARLCKQADPDQVRRRCFIRVQLERVATMMLRSEQVALVQQLESALQQSACGRRRHERQV